MEKIDLKKELKQLYGPPVGKIMVVDVPAMNFIMIDGRGDPNNSPEYQTAIEALYSLSYTLKFMVKKAKSVDYVVMPLEGLWWTDDMTQFSIANKSIWQWTALMMQPDHVTEDLYRTALEQVDKKKSLPALSRVRWERFHEGLSVQTLYIGPFAAEGPTIEQLHRFIEGNGYKADGRIQKHHEIYLSDFRKTAQEKLRTIIRQPMLKR